MTNEQDLPEKASEALELWDKGETLWSVEMGGLGPSYEMSIQFSVFELIRFFNGVAPSLQGQLDKAMHVIDKKMDFGHSGATAAAAQSLAYKFMENGYRKTMEGAPSDRKIQIEKTHWNFEKKAKAKE